MSLKGLTQLSIRKDKINIRQKGQLPPVDYDKFRSAIEGHMPFFIWREDVEPMTPELESFLQKQGHDPEDYYKHMAYCLPVKNKRYYRFSISYLKGWNKISITNTASGGMSINLLETLYDIAELCECKLYNSDTRFITRERIEKEKALILEKKQTRQNKLPITKA